MNNHLQAFPRTSELGSHPGMDLRDWWAGNIAAVLVSRHNVADLGGITDEEYAEAAYSMADALIAVRNRTRR